MPRKFIPRPDAVRIGHRMYEIVYLTDQEWRTADYGDNRGITLHAVGRIALLLDYDGDIVCEAVLRETLLHEVLHACTNSSMLWNTWDHMKDYEWNHAEEAIVGAMSPLALGMLRDNPEVLAYLLDDREHSS